MTSSQLNTQETPPMSAEDLEGLKDDNGLYAGKFKSIEDLASSYKELEGKLGNRSQEETVEETTEETTEESEFNPNEYYGDGLASVLEEVGIDPQEISQRFVDNDSISEDDYSKLETAGFSKQVIDTYLDGLRGGDPSDSSEIAPQIIQGIKDSVGGDETYGQMQVWAEQNLSDEEGQAFNNLMDTADAPTIKLAVEGLYSRYQKTMGVEPSLYSGRPASSGPTPYRSSTEVVAAMSDKRYGKDQTYTEDVQRRLEFSDVFKTRG
tara:strand:- start:946 stop:1740 length:795 start_codon:yes stop_codon:yes gene_type:complete